MLFYPQFTDEETEAQDSGVTSPECSLQTWCQPTRGKPLGCLPPKSGGFHGSCHPGRGYLGTFEDPHLNPGFQETHEECRELIPRGLPGKEGQGARAPKVHPLESWWAPTFLELDLKGVRAVGGFGRVLGLCVEAWRRLVLTRQKEVGGWCVRAKLGQVSLLQPPPEPGSCWHCGLLASPASGPASQPPYLEPASLARGLGNKGLEKSDNFSPQLDLIFFFDAPTAGGGIAGGASRAGKA